MNHNWWTQLTDSEVAEVEQQDGIYGASVVLQCGTDRTLRGQDDVGNFWQGTWYDGESIRDIRWMEVECPVCNGRGYNQVGDSAHVESCVACARWCGGRRG